MSPARRNEADRRFPGAGPFGRVDLRWARLVPFGSFLPSPAAAFAATAAFAAIAASVATVAFVAIVGWAPRSAAASWRVDADDEQRSPIERLADAAGERDSRAIRSAMDGILAAFDELPEKDRRGRAKLAAALGKMLDYRDPRDGTVSMRAADILGMMGDSGADVLQRELRQKKYEKDEDQALQRDALILALGHTKSEQAVGTLLEYLEHHDANVAAIAAQALGEFGEAPGKLRKRIVADLVQALQVADNQGRSQRPRPGGGTSSRTKNDRSRAQRLMGPAHTTLTKLTGVSHFNTEEWDTWFRENKRRDWDEEKEKDD